MELGGVLAVVKRFWATLLAAALLGGLAGYAVGGRAPQSYEARVRLLVGPVSTDLETLRASGQLARTYAELVTSQAILGPAISALGLPLTSEELAETVDPTADSTTRLLIIRVTDADPGRAAAVANELAAQLTRLASEDVRPEGQLSVVDQSASGVPVESSVDLTVVLAALGGLLGALALVLVAEYFNNTVRTEQELAELTQADFLGAIAAGPRRRRRDPTAPLVVQSAPLSQRAADYRLLATKLDLSAARQPIQSVLVLSVRGEGSAELSANVGLVLAQQKRRVTVVDANPGGDVSGLLGLAERPGLSDLVGATYEDLAQDPPLELFAEQWRPDLRVVPRGRPEALQGVQVTPAPWLVERFKEATDLVLIDAASIDASPASLVWARAADATILVVHRERVSWSSVSQVVESIRMVGGNVLGAVFEEGRARSRLSLGAGLTGWLDRSGRSRGAMGGSRNRHPVPSPALQPHHTQRQPHHAQRPASEPTR